MLSHVPDSLWAKRARILTQALIVSGALNIGLLATFAHFVLKEKQASLTLELKPTGKEALTAQRTNEQLLQAYSLLPLPELLLRLENQDIIEDGLRKRDLALSCLVAFHHLDIERAIGKEPLQKRTVWMHNIEGQEAIELSVFPGLADFHFQALIQFVKTEKWPLTAQGLFYEIKRSPIPYDTSLVQAFSLTEEYQLIHTLFAKTGTPLSPPQTMTLLSEGTWKSIASFVDAQKQNLDLSIEARKQFLLSLLGPKTRYTAQLLFQTEPEFVAKRLDDSQVQIILENLESHAARTLAQELLPSSRTDAVHRQAATLLYQLAGEPLPEPFDYSAALAKFSPNSLPAPLAPVVQHTLPKKRYHTVEPGESLWKIARKYKVSVPSIMQANHLETEKLKVGRQLEIPEKQS